MLYSRSIVRHLPKLPRIASIASQTISRPFLMIATRSQMDKMLPYVVFSLVGVVAISVLTRGDPLLALLIFTSAVLFIFSIYLMVPMLYRTFKDTTFISILATALTTAYLIVPAMFSDISARADSLSDCAGGRRARARAVQPDSDSRAAMNVFLALVKAVV